MNENVLLNLILNDADRIAVAVTTGAGWEVWMQVELATIVRQAGYQVAREVFYPPPFNRTRLDLLIGDRNAGRNNIFAVEMKVESATNGCQASGQPILTALENDVQKILSYDIEGLVARWVVGIAYSACSKRKFRELEMNFPGAILIGENNGIMAMIIDANQFQGAIPESERVAISPFDEVERTVVPAKEAKKKVE